MRVSFAFNGSPQLTMGKALVLKLPAAVSVKITELFAGMVKLPHRLLNTALERCKSTTTLSTVIGLPVVLSSRRAPAARCAPPLNLTRVTWGAACQGTGKFALALVLSAKPTATANPFWETGEDMLWEEKLSSGNAAAVIGSRPGFKSAIVVASGFTCDQELKGSRALSWPK